MRAITILAHILTQLIFGGHPAVDSTQNLSTSLRTMMNDASYFAEYKKEDGFVEALIPFEERMRSKFQYHSSHGDVTVTTTKSNYPQNKQRNLRIASNETSYYPMRLHFDTSNLDRLRNGNTEREILIDFIIESVLPRASNVWSSVLSVIPLKTSIPISKGTCFNEIDIPEEYIKQGVKNTDLAIFVTGGHCLEKNRLASASPCALSDINDRPVVGSIHFCLNAFELYHDITPQEELIKFTEVTVHELGHVLGMNSDLFPFFQDSETGNPLTPRPLVRREVTCINGRVKKIAAPASNTLKEVVTNSGRYFEIVTPTVVAVTRNQFNCHDLTGARLENQPTSFHDCYGSHWDERLFFTEIMSAVRNSATNILSPLTLALLQDSGWYKVNYKKAKISPFGYGAGCEFVNERCILNGKVPKHSKGFFCNTKTEIDEFGDLTSPPTCDTTHTTVSACDLTDLPFEDDKIDKKYFNGQALGPQHFNKADFCPMAIISIQDCRDMSGKIPFKGITYGTSSKCFNFKVSKGIKNSPMAYCLETVCNQESKLLDVIIGENRITCDFDGQIHQYPYYKEFTFECPRLASVCPQFTCPANCSGRGICDFSLKNAECICFDENDNTPGCYGSTVDDTDDKDDMDGFKISTDNTPTISTRRPSEYESSKPTMAPMAIIDFTQKGLNNMSLPPTTDNNMKGITINFEVLLTEFKEGGKYFFYAALACGLIILMKTSKSRCAKNNQELSSKKLSNQSSRHISASLTSQNEKSTRNHDKPSSRSTLNNSLNEKKRESSKHSTKYKRTSSKSNQRKKTRLRQKDERESEDDPNEDVSDLSDDDVSESSVTDDDLSVINVGK